MNIIGNGSGIDRVGAYGPANKNSSVAQMFKALVQESKSERGGVKLPMVGSSGYSSKAVANAAQILRDTSR